MRITPSRLAVACVLGLSASLAKADSISPSTYSDTLAVGESVTITKTVTVDAGTPTDSKVDVFFLTDSTGSMGALISAVKTAAATILANTSGLGDVAYGVGEYRDVFDAFVYRLNQDITTDTTAVQNGINQWFAGGGGDFPEANLFGLEQVAEGASWRAGSERVLVWFGDAPGHDPSNGSTEASATAALVAEGIAVQAVDVGLLDTYGQAVRIANATGGTYNAGINTADIVDVITDLITTAVETYTSVGLDLADVPAGVSVSYTPVGGHVGAWDRSVAREFEFEVTFTGDAPGDYTFPIYATVDRGRVATEEDHIVVTGTPRVPDMGSTLGLLGAAFGGLAVMRRRR
jgi:hypothetical protein